VIASHAVVYEEKSRRVVVGFDGREPVVVFAPKGAVPIALKKIAFRQIAALTGCGST
jgi:hypothetical protein